MRIEIINWNKYQIRKDIKMPWWFALSNRLPLDPDFYHFTHEEKWAWICILCFASFSNSSGKVKIEILAFCTHYSVAENALKSAIKKLKKINWIREIRTRSVRDPYAICTGHVKNPYATRQDKTIQDKTEQNKLPMLKLKFERMLGNKLELIYQKYPRKSGKAVGMRSARRQIKTEDDLAALDRAVDRFVKQMKQESRDKDKIPYFSTFMNGQWSDCLDEDYGTGLDMKKNFWDEYKKE